MTDQTFENPCQGRLVAGARPRGPIHLGELVGAIESWVFLQESYECIFLIADEEVQNSQIFTEFKLRRATYEMLADWLACGISPNNSIIALESAIPERLQLTELLMKALEGSKDQTDLSVPQADETMEAVEMLLFKANSIPLVEGQPRNNLARAQSLGLAFNQKYGDVFPIPKEHPLKGGHLPGLDGHPMQRSSYNLILLKEFDEETQTKIHSAAVDTLIAYASRFDRNQNRAKTVIQEYAAGRLDEAQLRNHVAALLNDYLHSARVKRDKWIGSPMELESVLQVGARRARAVALETIIEVKTKLGMETV